jgi:hypothetical protein
MICYAYLRLIAHHLQHPEDREYFLDVLDTAISCLHLLALSPAHELGHPGRDWYEHDHHGYASQSGPAEYGVQEPAYRGQEKGSYHRSRIEANQEPRVKERVVLRST